MLEIWMSELKETQQSRKGLSYFDGRTGTRRGGHIHTCTNYHKPMHHTGSHILSYMHRHIDTLSHIYTYSLTQS